MYILVFKTESAIDKSFKSVMLKIQSNETTYRLLGVGYLGECHWHKYSPSM
jgi:hypothetical protein